MKLIIKFTTEITNGMKAIFNANHINKNKRKAILANYGERAVAQDWKNVGNDIHRGMKQYEVRYGINQ